MNTSKLIRIRKEIISNSVDRLNRFGFTNVNEVNIFEDDVYKGYFIRILLERMGVNTDYDSMIRTLILELT